MPRVYESAVRGRQTLHRQGKETSKSSLNKLKKVKHKAKKLTEAENAQEQFLKKCEGLQPKMTEIQMLA